MLLKIFFIASLLLLLSVQCVRPSAPAVRAQARSRTAPPQSTAGVAQDSRLQECQTAVSKLRESLLSQGRDLKEAKAALASAESRLRELGPETERLRSQNTALAQENARLSDEAGQMAALRGERDRLSSQLSSLRSDLNGIKGERDRLQAERNDLSGQLNSLQANVRGLKADMDGVTTERDGLIAERNKLRADSAGLTIERDKLRVDNAGLVAERDALKKSEGDLSGHLNELQSRSDALFEAFGQSRDKLDQLKSPAATMSLIAARNAESATQSPPVVIEEAGKVHVIRDLAIGILNLTYEKELKPGVPFRLTAELKPNRVLDFRGLKGAEEVPIRWFVELQYDPQTSKAEYNKKASGDKDSKRELRPGDPTETWIWDMKPSDKFETDESPLIVYAAYEMPDGQDRQEAGRQNVQFHVQRSPGLIAEAFGFVKNNLSVLLGALAAAFGLAAAYLAYQRQKAETQLAQQRAALAAAEAKV